MHNSVFAILVYRPQHPIMYEEGVYAKTTQWVAHNKFCYLFYSIHITNACCLKVKRWFLINLKV